MRDAVRRLFTVRPPTRIVQVRVPAIIAGRRGLPVLLSAFAVVAAASTAATTTTSAAQTIAAPAGTTVLPQVAPPTYSYPGSSEATAGTPGAATRPGGTGLNGGQSGSPATSQLAANGIPARAAQAYQAAAVAAGCGIPWTLIAAIGRVESDHGRFGGATLLADGRSDPPIVGIPLDGRPGVAVIKDTDSGKWDGDTAYDRAVGPMQFIPGSWARFGVDGDSDGKIDPFDIDDAAASAAKYLCKAGGDLSNETGQRNAVYSYNRSTAYVDNVLALAALYAGNAPVDNSPTPGGAPPPISPPTLPPGTIGDPPAAPGTAHPTPARTTPKPKPTKLAPTPHPSSPAPTPHPSSPAPTTTRPPTPAPTTTPVPTQPSTPAPTSSSPSATPSPTCTPSPSPSSSGTNTPNGTASAGATPTASPTSTGTATGTASANATGTPTPSPSPTLPPCPS